MNAPATTNGASHHVHATHAKTPSAVAAAIETTASTHSVRSGIRVCSGRPRSSSRACAPTPIPSANASSAAPQRVHENGEARPAPIATNERCQSVYGGWSSVT
jgi:hypothetical protein